MNHATLSIPKDIWQWDVFGSRTMNGRVFSLMTIMLPWDVPFYQRLLTRIFLMSKWTRVAA